MNDEIKEILDKLKDDDWYDELDLTGDKWIELKQTETKQILDYITSLQKENKRLKAQLTDTEWEYQNTRCKYEKQYKKGITEELLEDIETCFFNRENPSMIPIDSLDICHIFGYIDYLKDYKSRIDKAVEYIKENQEEEYVTGNSMLSYWAIDNLLNILQNGSENDD